MRQMPLFCSSTRNTANKVARPLSNRMLGAVFFWANKRKIFQPVVFCVSIFMMHMNAFWGFCNHTMLVRPFIRLCNFYPNVGKTVTSFVQTGASYRKLNPYLFQYTLSGTKNLWRKCFISTVNTTWGIVICVPINALFSYNGQTAKRAWFRSKFFHAPIIYQAS